MMLQRRVLVVVPGLPEHDSDGSAMFYELLSWLNQRVAPDGEVAVVGPVPDRRWNYLQSLERDPAFTRTLWHPLEDRRAAEPPQRLQNMLGPLSADTVSGATATNTSMLKSIRTAFRPTVELVVSSWGLSPYRGRRLPAASAVRVRAVWTSNAAAADATGEHGSSIFLPPFTRPDLAAARQAWDAFIFA